MNMAEHQVVNRLISKTVLIRILWDPRFSQNIRKIIKNSSVKCPKESPAAPSKNPRFPKVGLPAASRRTLKIPTLALKFQSEKRALSPNLGSKC